MTLLPVVAREMTVLARRSASYWARSGAALAALLVMIWLLGLTAETSFLALGRSIFTILSGVGFVFALLAGIYATADCVSEEKREGTLGLLFLTDLKSYDVILGKLSATSLSAAYALLAILPMISLGLLVGGVTLREVGLVAAILANTLFLSLAVGVFVSTLSINERRSILAAAVTLFLLTVGPGLLVFYRLAGSFRPLQSAWDEIGWISPAYPLLAVYARSVAPAAAPGWLWPASMFFHHLLAWALLLLSCRILPLFINETPVLRAAHSPGSSAGSRIVSSFLFGSRQARDQYRARLLNRNPFLWLVSRERGKPKYAWFLVLFFAALYGWVFYWFPNLAHDLPINIVIILTIHGSLKLWLTSEVCHRLIQDRRAGALELLLPTPLTVPEIARGQTLALRRIFAWPVAMLLLGETALAIAAWHSGRLRPPPMDRVLTYAAAGSTLLLDFWALKWFGLWRSLRGRSIERVLLSTLALLLAIPWLLYATLYGAFAVLEALSSNPTPYRTHLLAWWGISLLWSLWLGLPARWRFLHQFRELAAGRFDSAPAPVPREGAVRSRPRPRLLWRLREHPVAAGLLLLFLSVAAVALARKNYWSLRFGQEIRRVRAERFPASLAECHRMLTQSSAPGNAAALVILRNPVEHYAFAYWDGMRYGAGTRIYGGGEPDFSGLLAQNARHLDAVRALTNFAALDLPLTNGVHFGRYSAVACLDFIVAKRGGETARAWSDAAGLIALARLLRAMPVPGAQHFACDVLGSLAFILQGETSFSPPQLAALAQALDGVDRQDRLAGSLAFSRAVLLDPGFVSFHYVDENVRPVRELKAAIDGLLAFTGSAGKDRCEAALAVRRGIEAANSLPLPERLDAFADWIVPLPWRGEPGSRTVLNQYRHLVLEAVRNDAEIAARIRLLQAGLAAQRHLQGHSSPPRQPGDLVPEFLPAWPVDPFTGEGLKLRTLGRHAIIYSAGRNRADDNGTAAPYQDPDSGDYTFVISATLR